jgi:hypothetical protein
MRAEGARKAAADRKIAPGLRRRPTPNRKREDLLRHRKAKADVYLTAALVNRKERRDCLIVRASGGQGSQQHRRVSSSSNQTAALSVLRRIFAASVTFAAICESEVAASPVSDMKAQSALIGLLCVIAS